MLGVLTYQYSVTVNDSVESVSNGEDCAFFKFVADSLLDEDVSSERTGNTTPEQRNKTLFQYTLGQGVYLTQNNGSSEARYIQSQVKRKKESLTPYQWCNVMST